MTETPGGTPVGVDDPYEHAGVCDHLANDGQCRFAVEQGDRDPEFAEARSREEFRCPVAGDPAEDGPTGPWDWSDCPHFRSRADDRECARCGLEAKPMAHDGERPLLEEHHLSYADEETLSHEVTVYLCRWCHAKVHKSWARVDDDVNPDQEALAEREERRSRELAEAAFESAADRFDLGE